MNERANTGPTIKPTVDVFESEKEITVLADLPGVKAQDLEIDLRDNVLTLTARAAIAQGAKETDVLRELGPKTFVRQFTLSEAIDQSKIAASLTHGVLRLELPKVEKARSRRITVKAS